MHTCVHNTRITYVHIPYTHTQHTYIYIHIGTHSRRAQYFDLGHSDGVQPWLNHGPRTSANHTCSSACEKKKNFFLKIEKKAFFLKILIENLKASHVNEFCHTSFRKEFFFVMVQRKVCRWHDLLSRFVILQWEFCRWRNSWMCCMHMVC